VRVVRAKVGPAGTTKDTKARVIWFGTEEFVDWCFIGQSFGGGSVDKIGGRKKF
jgi:hypothetical protein